MANSVELSWGTSIEIIEDVTEMQGRQVHSAGVNLIKPYEMIPLHSHFDDDEEYIPQIDGLKIIVMPADEAERKSTDEVLEMFINADNVAIGEVVTCHKGEAHALYNDSDEYAPCVFIKYL